MRDYEMMYFTFGSTRLGSLHCRFRCSAFPKNDCCSLQSVCPNSCVGLWVPCAVGSVGGWELAGILGCEFLRAVRSIIAALKISQPYITVKQGVCLQKQHLSKLNCQMHEWMLVCVFIDVIVLHWEALVPSLWPWCWLYWRTRQSQKGNKTKISSKGHVTMGSTHSFL